MLVMFFDNRIRFKYLHFLDVISVLWLSIIISEINCAVYQYNSDSFITLSNTPTKWSPTYIYATSQPQNGRIDTFHSSYFNKASKYSTTNRPIVTLPSPNRIKTNVVETHYQKSFTPYYIPLVFTTLPQRTSTVAPPPSKPPPVVAPLKNFSFVEDVHYRDRDNGVRLNESSSFHKRNSNETLKNGLSLFLDDYNSILTVLKTDNQSISSLIEDYYFFNDGKNNN